MTAHRWTAFRPFPDPRKGELLHAPIGPGVYDLRHISTKEPILFGIGSRCALRMSSLLPKPLGAGTRNNTAKRDYVLKHINDIEYRTLPCATRDEAAQVERDIKSKRGHDYKFKT